MQLKEPAYIFVACVDLKLSVVEFVFPFISEEEPG